MLGDLCDLSDEISSCVPAFLSDPASSIVDLQEPGAGRLVHRIGERFPSVIGIVVHILGLLFSWWHSNAALGVSAFVLAATVGGFRLGLLLMIAVSAGTFACVLALPAHSLHDTHQIDALE